MSKLYNKVASLADSKYPFLFLGFISYIEAIVLPIPTDVLLVPLVIAFPRRWILLCIITVLTSVAGGVTGFIIGKYTLSYALSIFPAGINDAFLSSKIWFVENGVFSVLVAGFSPIPYKVIALTAGACDMNLTVFTLASIFSRGLRFFLVSWLSLRFQKLRSYKLYFYADLTGWAIMISIFVAIIL